MTTTNIIEFVKTHCKLYKNETTNPYSYSNLKDDEWILEYLKFNIWDAEYSVVQNFTWWSEIWEEQNPNCNLSQVDKAEEIYKLAILDKLKKMQRPDIDFIQLYFSL